MKNKNKLLIIIIVLLSILILLLGSYIVYDKFISKDVPANNEELNKSDDTNMDDKKDDVIEEILELNDPTVQLLYSYINPYGKPNANYDDYFLKNKDLTVESFENDKKFAYASFLLNFDEIEYPNHTYYDIPYETYDKAIKKFFGEDIVYSKDSQTNEDFRFTVKDFQYNSNSFKIMSFKYDQATNKYHGYLGSFGDRLPILLKYYYKLVSASKSEDLLILKEKFIVTDRIDNPNIDTVNYFTYPEYNIYSDYNKENLIGYEKITLDSSNSTHNEFLEDGYPNKFNMDSYLEKAGTVTYTFKLGSDNEYHFVSSHIEK